MAYRSVVTLPPLPGTGTLSRPPSPSRTHRLVGGRPVGLAELESGQFPGAGPVDDDRLGTDVPVKQLHVRVEKLQRLTELVSRGRRVKSGHETGAMKEQPT